MVARKWPRWWVSARVGSLPRRSCRLVRARQRARRLARAGWESRGGRPLAVLWDTNPSTSLECWGRDLRVALLPRARRSVFRPLAPADRGPWAAASPIGNKHRLRWRR